MYNGPQSEPVVKDKLKYRSWYNMTTIPKLAGGGMVNDAQAEKNWLLLHLIYPSGSSGYISLHSSYHFCHEDRLPHRNAGEYNASILHLYYCTRLLI